MGSKNKIAKELLPIILKDHNNNVYIEPFCGGCNIIDKVNGKRIANDSNSYLISLWKALQNGYVPPETVTREDYYRVKNNIINERPELVAFIGFLCSFGGKWWGGYAFNNKGDNYAARGQRQLLKQIQLLKDVEFLNENYINLVIPDNSIVYCDPPYQNTTKYKDSFNHDAFWDWVRKISKNNKVFVSEYVAPEDFECIKEIMVNTPLNKNVREKRIEKLFQLKK